MRITKFHIPKLLTVLGLACLGLLLLMPQHAKAANPTTINFQGKIVNFSDGTNITNPNNTYSIVFRIYNTSSPTMTTSCTSTASCLWQETQASVQLTNGIFQVELGSSCALTSSSCNNSAGGPINFANSNSLYLTMQFNGDTSGSNGGFMSPLIHITSVPFALQADNAASLGGLAAGNFVQLAQGVQNDTSATNPSIFINKNNASGTPNILQLQKAGNNVLVIDNGGLITLQPAANLVGGQTAVTQTLTNSDSTGGTVIGYNQTINVNNSVSSGVTNGIKITLTDNTSLLGNTNVGINVTVNGSNTSQAPTGIIALANNGEGIRGRSGGGGSSACGTTNYSAGIGTCGESLATGNSGTSTGVGVFGSSRSGNQTSFNNLVAGGAGTVGLNESTGTASSFYVGIKGLSTQTAAAAYSSTGVFGQGNAGAGATIYGGYFTLGTGGATAGAALYASNSTVAANILDLQDGNAGSGGTNISVLTVGNGGVITANSNSATGLVINNSSSSKAVITIDTSGNQVILGTSGASGIDGQLTFKNATGSGTASIVLTGNPSTNYTYQLPTGTVSSNQCLQSGTVSSGNVPLTFGSCGSGGGTFATTYSTTSQANNTITYSNSGGGALIIQNASTPLTTLFTIQNNAATFNYLTVTLASSVPHLQVFGASSSEYADIYYDASAHTAFFKASGTNTTQIGSGSGPVNITAGASSAVAITGHANSTFTTDSGYVRLDGPSGVQIGVPSSSSGNLVFNYGSGAATASITFAGNGTANYIYTLPSTAVSSNQCLQSGTVSGTAVPLTFGSCGSGSGTALSVDGVSVGSTANFADTASSGTTTSVNFTNTSGTVTAAIGNASTTAAGSVTTGSQSFAGDKIFQSTTNSSTAFQLQNSVGAAIFSVDTTSTDATGAQVNYLAYSGFESGAFNNASAGWNAVSPGTISQNTNRQHTFNGTHSVQLTTTTSNGGLTTSSFAATPSTTGNYLISFYAKVTSGASMTGANFTVQTTDGTTHTCNPSASVTLATSTVGFQRLFCQITTTGTITAMQITQNNGVAHTIYIDSVQLQRTAYNGGTLTAPSAYQFGEIYLRGVISNPLIVANNGDSTSAFQVQKTSGAAVITADTLNGQVLLGNASSLTGALVFNNSAGTNSVTLAAQSSNPGSSFTLSLPTALPGASNYCIVSTNLGVLSFSACGASSTATVTLAPEFLSAVMTGDGTSNTGTMTSDFCSGSSRQNIGTAICTVTTESHNYYDWTSTGANDYEIWVRWQVPSDFASFSSGSFYGWKTASGDAVTMNVYNNSASACATQATSATTGSWQSNAITMTGCAPSAGNVITIDIHLGVAANGNHARVGEITLTYNRN